MTIHEQANERTSLALNKVCDVSAWGRGRPARPRLDAGTDEQRERAPALPDRDGTGEQRSERHAPPDRPGPSARQQQFADRVASEEPLYAGVDGGGSKTLVVVVDAHGRERGRAVAAGANQAAVGPDQAITTIRAAMADALHMAGSTATARAAWFGLAGVDRPADQDALLPHLRALAGAVRLTNDAELILSALDEAVGVALIGGTGAIALGRDARGATVRAGGWGHIVGDEGSGYDLGRRCLQAVLRADDGRGPETALLDLVSHEWRLARPSDLVGRVYPDGDKRAIAGLAPLVLGAARAGDPVAGDIVASGAEELALSALTVADRLAFPEGLPLALAGGLLIHETDYRESVLEHIRQRRDVSRVAIVAHPAESAARAAIGLVARDA